MMKRLLFPIMFFLAGSLIAQPMITSREIVPQYQTISMKGMDRVHAVDVGRRLSVYIVYPRVVIPKPIDLLGFCYIDTIPPTAAMIASNNLRFGTTGDVFLSLTLVETGTDESDSLSSWIKPLWYDRTLSAWHTSLDSTFLVWGTPGTYTSTAATQLNWTSGGSYSCTLSGLLWPCQGFVLTFESCMDANIATVVAGYLGIHFVQ
jgi:hypothetical protein